MLSLVALKSRTFGRSEPMQLFSDVKIRLSSGTFINRSGPLSWHP